MKLEPIAISRDEKLPLRSNDIPYQMREQIGVGETDFLFSPAINERTGETAKSNQ